MPTIAVLLLLAATPSPESAPSWATLSGSMKASTGAEWDTNAGRAVSGNEQNVLIGASRSEEITEDALLRLLLDTALQLRLGRRHRVSLTYVIGAKRFVRQGDQDLLAHNLSLSSQHQLSKRIRAGASGWFKGSRIRSGFRDYNLGILSTHLGAHLGTSWHLNIGAEVRTFRFYNESRFNYWGPQGNLRIAYQPTKALEVSARGALSRRSYKGNALVEGRYILDPSAPPLLLFCENPAFEAGLGIECTPAGKRQDTEGQVELSARIRTRLVLARGGYLIRLQRSNSDFENINRHRLYAQLTGALPWLVTVNLLATLQVNDGVSITDTKYLAEDDENQNSARIQVRRPLTDDLDLEFNYGVFANQFSTADVSFFRQTISLGIRTHIDGSQDY